MPSAPDRLARGRAQSGQALSALGSGIDCTVPVSRLARTERSIVAIVRALALNTDVLVLDEPTASLPESETARLFEVLHRLRARGVSIIYVTHRLDEVFRLADMVTVLRDGRVVRSCPVAGTTPTSSWRPSSADRQRRCLQTTRIARRGTFSTWTICGLGRVGPVSFDVKAGEIVGLAGLGGQARTPLAVRSRVSSRARAGA